MVPGSVPVKDFGSDADDLKYFAADVDGTAENAGIVGETVGPVVVGDDGVGAGAGSAVVVSGEETAECGLQFEGGEHPAGDILHVALFHFIVGGIGQVGPACKGGGDEFSLTLSGGAHAGEFGIREFVEGAGCAIAIGNSNGENVETIGVRDRERAEEERVDEAEGGGAGADGEGEREDGGGGGDFALEQLAPAEDEVGTEAVEPGDDAGVAALFAQAELGAEAAAHFGGVIAGGDGFFNVVGEFLVNFAIETIPTEDVGDARPERHVKPPAERG